MHANAGCVMDVLGWKLGNGCPWLETTKVYLLTKVYFLTKVHLQKIVGNYVMDVLGWKLCNGCLWLETTKV